MHPITSVDCTEPATPILDSLEQRAGDVFHLHDQFLNNQMVRVLRTIGFDVEYTRAEGAYLFDASGNRYLDLVAGWGVFALGRNHPHVVSALCDVLSAQLPQLVQMGVSPLAGMLAERLVRTAPHLDKAFFCNSGTEAVEAAIKFSRSATGRPGLLYCEGAFHGLTCGALSLNGEAQFRDGFGPLLTDARSVPFNDLDALESALAAGDIAMFITEPIQGHGVNIPDDDYFREAARLCKRYGTLFVADEIQTGLGRTGRFYAMEHWGVEPDMVLLAKALSGGFVPIGAVLTRRWIFDRVFDRMDRAVVHGSTFSKNNLAMAAGLATLDVIEAEDLTGRAARMGKILIEELGRLVDRYEFLKNVRGKGLMIGLEFGEPRQLKLVAAWKLLAHANPGLFCQLVTIPLLKEHRILSQVAGHGINVVKFLPPLIIDDADARWITGSVEQVIAEAHEVPGSIWDLGKTLAGHALRNRSVAQGRSAGAQPANPAA